MFKSAFCLMLTISLCACATTSVTRYPTDPHGPANARQQIVIVIDGTSNDPRDRTNATRLHELISNQARPNLSIFYTEGVGSDGRFIGMATGWGMGKDVRDAYRFLAENWQENSDIYIFGFSRGAFGGRILSGLVHSAGLIRFEPGEHGGFSLTQSQRERIVDRLYDAYLHPGRVLPGQQSGPPTLDQRRRATARVIADSPVRVEHGIRIKGAGYFDTVAAMGVPDNQANPFRENTDPYLDQFCNVDHVFQAVSLDDNRALDFTPLLATDPRRIEPCTPSESHPDIREVWFSGAHADVGGTYSDERGLDGHLPGNSLNWMIAQIHSLFKVDEVRLLPVGAGQYANPLDVIHHARNGLAIWRARPLAFRRPLEWIGDSTLRIHFTVAQRFEQLVSIESNFSSRCAEHARRPTLRCVNDLKTNGFLGELLAHHCVREVETRIDSNTKVVGYGFLGQPEAVPHAAEMRFVQSPGTDVECSRIVIAFDTEAQRNAHLSDTWARPAPRED